MLESKTAAMKTKTGKESAKGHGTTHHSITVNRCFVCGPENPDGMHLKFYFDAPQRKAHCRFRVARRYQGPPGHAHGGIIAAILDEAMGKVNKLRSVIALTAEMQVEYLKPVPLCTPLLVVGTERRVRGRSHINVAEIRNQKNEVLARGRAVFIAIDPHKVFAKHLSPEEKKRLDAIRNAR